MRRQENYFSCLILRDLGAYWEGRQDGASLRAWSKECTWNNNCEVTPEDFYRQVYIKVKNGWPILIDLENSNLTSTYSLDNIFNTILHRTWIRSDDLGFHDPNIEKFWDSCKSKQYRASPQFLNSYERFHYKLQNGQEIKLSNTLYSVVMTSGKETKYLYHNISDSWVDVAYYLELHPYTEEWVLIYNWRVHGNNPDPWDAPDWIKSEIEIPPDPNRIPRAKIKTCYHLSSNAYGTIQYNNVESIDVLNQSSIPIETHVAPIKGTWSGLHWQSDVNPLVYNLLSTSFKKIRIEKYENYHRIYISYGDGAPYNASGFIIDLATEQDKWETRTYGITFDLSLDGSINFIEQGSNYNFPTDINDQIVRDTELEINKLGTNYMIPAIMSPLLSSEGQIEYTRIYDELAASFGLGEDYTNEYTVYLGELNSLVKKQRSI